MATFDPKTEYAETSLRLKKVTANCEKLEEKSATLSEEEKGELKELKEMEKMLVKIKADLLKHIPIDDAGLLQSLH